jgi:hypothetical protein
MKKERFGKMSDKAQERIAEALQVALFDFLSAVKQGVVSPAQRSALERALTNAKDLPDALYLPPSPERASERRTGLDPLAQATRRTTDDSRQHAPAWRAAACCLLPQRRLPTRGADRRVELSGRHRGSVVSLLLQLLQHLNSPRP